MRALITESTAARQTLCDGFCAGIAYVRTFDDATTETAPNRAQPAWVFAQAGNNASSHVAEAVSHEVATPSG